MTTAREVFSFSVNSCILVSCLFGKTIVSKGQTAQKGTTTTQSGVSSTILSYKFYNVFMFK